MALKSFEVCIKEASGKKHLLLGNGFSRACRDDIFSYQSLFDSADFSKKSKELKKAFGVLGTTDFEAVMRSLMDTAKLIPLYVQKGESAAKAMLRDVQGLRKLLVETLTAHHPAMPSEIPDSKYEACKIFLSHFDRIYTVNYDLLLYWTYMKVQGEEKDKALGERKEFDDGFRDPFDGDPKEYQRTDYVSWGDDTIKQNTYYLHGALHIYYSGSELKKYCWNRTDVRLLAQISDALKKDLFPLIVAEGLSEQKLSRIKSSDYLSHCYRSLGRITGNLFVYGHSLADNDRHIFKKVAGNLQLKSLYVGLFGQPDSKDNKRIKETVLALAKNRHEKKPLEVQFFSSQTAKVWG